MSPRPEALDNIPDVIAETTRKIKTLVPITELRDKGKGEIKRVSELLDRSLSAASSSLRHTETAAGIFTGEEDDWPQARLVGFFLDDSIGDEDSKRSAVHPIMRLGERYFLLAGHGFKKVYEMELDEKKEQATIRNCEPLNGQWQVSKKITKSYGWLALLVPLINNNIIWTNNHIINVGVVLDETSPHSTTDFLDVITGGALEAMYHDACRGLVQGDWINKMETQLTIVGKISEGLRLASE